MRGLLSLGLLAATFGMVAADDKKDPTAGKWVIESVTRDGKADASLNGAVRTQAGGKYTLTPPAGSKSPEFKGVYKVEGTKTPGTIDLIPTGGRYKDQTLKGIFKVDGDTLTLAFAEPGKDRPANFESKPGTGVVVAVHKKAK